MKEKYSISTKSSGVIFTDAHVSATVCGPSRAGLLTGRYQQRFGFECNPPNSDYSVDANEKTLPEALKEINLKEATGFRTS